MNEAKKFGSIPEASPDLVYINKRLEVYVDHLFVH